MTIRAHLTAGVLALMCYACQPQPSARNDFEQGVALDTRWPSFDYASSADSVREAFRLDPDQTLIDIVVRRDGPLARFGHDHVVSVQEPEGYLLLDRESSASRADLRFLLDRLVIDSDAARQRYGLDTEPSESDIDGTRTNLMDRVLNAEQWPWVSLKLTEFTWHGEHHSAMLTIVIQGASYSTSQPFRLQPRQSGVLVEGFSLIRQTDLGIEPFSTLGGGLRVADPLEIHFRITGIPLNAAAP